MINPKESFGVRKAPMSTVPVPVLMELGVAMQEGACKYGRHNYRAIGSIKSSVYYDAAMRHLMAWWEGENIDVESGLSHITKAIASLVILRDAMMQHRNEDDRPIRAVPWLDELNKKSDELAEKYPNPVKPYTELDKTLIET